MATQPELELDERSRQVRQRLHEVVEAHHRNRVELGELLAIVQERGYWRE